jgi:hypothetical protein
VTWDSSKRGNYGEQEEDKKRRQGVFFGFKKNNRKS